jgi:aminoglycoside phosphotransferase (APT) family kinase protein
MSGADGVDEAAAMRAPLEKWLSQRRPDAEALRIEDFESPKSGFSARTLFAKLRYRMNGEAVAERVVFRIENPEPAIYPQQAPGLDVEVELQYRVMEALEKTGAAPLAPLVGYEPDSSVIGSQFFAMGHMDGEVTIENPPYTQQGFFVEASPEERRAMIEDGLRILAAVHAVDHRAAGLDWLAPPDATPGVLAQLDLWESFGRRELRDRVHPTFELGVAWLRANLPGPLENGFGWGDSRLGNIIFKDARALCITDFENAAIHPPEVDLGWWLMFDRTQHECVSTQRLDGEPTREQQRAIYEKFSGRSVGDTHFFEVLAALRYTAIVVRVMNRGVDRGMVPPDHEIWLRNPAANCLAELLGVPLPD